MISDATFTIKWTIRFGMRMNDSLAATYMFDGDPGLVIYRVDGDGLSGVWAIRGHDGAGTEHLTPRD